jgi:hypothetical protein
MKKITLVLVVLLAAGAMAFAQDYPTAEEATAAMERLAELEAQPAITASADLTFEFGDSNLEADTPNLPVFSYAKSAKAELGLSSGDEKVQATATLDLLAAASATSTFDQSNINKYQNIADENFNYTTYTVYDNKYIAYMITKGWIQWWNANYDNDILNAADEFSTDYNDADGAGSSDDAIDVAGGDDYKPETMALIMDVNMSWEGQYTDAAVEDYQEYDFVAERDDAVITMKDLVAPDADTDDNSFNFADSDDDEEVGYHYYRAITTNTGEINSAIAALKAEMNNQVVEYLIDELDADIDDFIDNTDFDGIVLAAGADGNDTLYEILLEATDGDLTNDTGVALTTFVDPGNTPTLITALDTLGTDHQFNQLFGDSEKAAISAVVDLYYSAPYSDTTNDATVTTTIAQQFLKSVTLKFVEVGGVLDITANFGNQHVSIGSINLDGSGHMATAVKTYPSLNLSLSAGVVEGLRTGIEFYTDDNGAKDAVEETDEWYTYTDETADNADPVEPKYGLKFNAGYTASIGDMSVGADAAMGMYDLLGAENLAFGFTVNPFFSGFGANAKVMFDYGLSMMLLGVAADYTIMGITPDVYFKYIMNDPEGAYQLGYSSAPKTTSAMVMSDMTGGMLIGGGVKADLQETVPSLPLGIKLGANIDLGLPTAAAATYIAWDGSIAVIPVENLTVSFGLNQDTAETETAVDWEGKVNYKYSIADVYFKFFSDYMSTYDKGVLGYTLGTKVSF